MPTCASASGQNPCGRGVDGGVNPVPVPHAGRKARLLFYRLSSPPPPPPACQAAGGVIYRTEARSDAPLPVLFSSESVYSPPRACLVFCKGKGTVEDTRA